MIYGPIPSEDPPSWRRDVIGGRGLLDAVGLVFPDGTFSFIPCTEVATWPDVTSGLWGSCGLEKVLLVRVQLEWSSDQIADGS